ncbi:hypothetical protein [Acidiphilium acidophilum]|uniref:Methyl-accepting chemotaxis protein n=1 Tax=Acidiphilium acidophilum TaxID=76588 RepID=A0AAW9DTA5_ACIAO|nr:hypothetical protein [Acidiphilium acidophilum]MDX5931578.1 hypothetical protein [Acidiphilium acidophilum]
MNTSEIARMMHNLKKSSQALRESEQALDVWSGAPLPSGPSYGPPQSASGGGAARMIGDYSNPAPQHGATATVEQLSRDLGSVLVTMRGMEQSQKALQDIVVSLIAAKAKADAEADDDDDDDDDDLRDAARREKARARLRKAAKSGNTEQALKSVDVLLGSIAVINSDVKTMMADLTRLATSGGRQMGGVAVQKSDFSAVDQGGILVRDRFTGEVRNSNDITPTIRRVVAKSGAIFESVAKSVAMLTEPTDRERGATILRMIESGRIDDRHICVATEAANGTVRTALAPLFA